MKLSRAFLIGSLVNSIEAVTEETQNLLVKCSIKPGDVETARMSKEDCEHIRGIFKEKSDQIAFIVKQATTDGYCVDVKCVNDSIIRKYKNGKEKKSKKSKKAKVCLIYSIRFIKSLFLVGRKFSRT
jgi:hypothetical protein